LSYRLGVKDSCLVKKLGLFKAFDKRFLFLALRSTIMKVNQSLTIVPNVAIQAASAFYLFVLFKQSSD